MRWVSLFITLMLISAQPLLAQSWEQQKRQSGSNQSSSDQEDDGDSRYDSHYEYDNGYLNSDEEYNAPSSRWDQASDEDVESFIDGNLYFVAFHEMGHALISEFSIPIAGREEDAVDRLAIWLMTPEDDQTDPDYLIHAMRGWFLAGEESMDDVSWWDEHGSNTQRAYQIACLLYGSDPDQLSDVADYAELPDDRRETCVEESQSNSQAWQRLLTPTVYPDNKGAQQRRAVTVQYQNTQKYREYRAYLQKLRLLEDLADLMNSTYRLKPGIRLLASECGESNAYWDAETRTLTMCYELVEDYQQMAQEDDE